MMKANGLTLHYTDSGETGLPVLVFANSLGTDLRVWDRLVCHLSGRFRMVRYDKRGHGLSGATPAPYGMDDLVSDAAAVLDGLGLTKVIFVGLSVGGQIAQGLAARRPDLVRALVLMDTAHKISTPEMWNTRISAIDEGGIAALAEPILERWFSAQFRSQRADELAGWRAMLTRTPKDGYLGTCAAIRDTDFTTSTAAISVPVLCLCGSEDGSTPPELVRSTAALVAGARYVEIPGAGHLPCVEFPDTVADAITTFLQENSLV
ncbi:3-oxoadipate enol-lactonase [Roseibium aestuarii]|uniref:3-oxoadipate enol-lactonase n=1 Tax=Roseibium aestuarii TaxID=2600299 RepID=A0ABW4JR55_9HYPH|nr:3-oxoadipate enol-lactonase [Roseibium aestuarii]